MRSVRIGCGAARRRGARRFQAATVAALTVVLAGVAAGCGVVGSGAKPAGEAQAPTDPVAASARTWTVSARTSPSFARSIEAAQRAATEHADRAAGETRTEVDAVQKALEASARHDLQRQVEVLDAQARRIDLLDKRAAEQGQTLRRLELALTGIESQLTRVLENPGAAPARGARSGRRRGLRPRRRRQPRSTSRPPGAGGGGLRRRPSRAPIWPLPRCSG